MTSDGWRADESVLCLELEWIIIQASLLSHALPTAGTTSCFSSSPSAGVICLPSPSEENQNRSERTGDGHTLDSAASLSVLSSTSFNLLPLSPAARKALAISLSPLMLVALKKNLNKIQRTKTSRILRICEERERGLKPGNGIILLSLLLVFWIQIRNKWEQIGVTKKMQKFKTSHELNTKIFQKKRNTVNPFIFSPVVTWAVLEKAFPDEASPKSSSLSSCLTPPPKNPLKKLCFGGSGISTFSWEMSYVGSCPSDINFYLVKFSQRIKQVPGLLFVDGKLLNLNIRGAAVRTTFENVLIKM